MKRACICYGSWGGHLGDVICHKRDLMDGIYDKLIQKILSNVILSIYHLYIFKLFEF